MELVRYFEHNCEKGLECILLYDMQLLLCSRIPSCTFPLVSSSDSFANTLLFHDSIKRPNQLNR